MVALSTAPTLAYGRCINGVIDYEAFICSILNHAVMSFDLRSEKLSLIKFPMDGFRCYLVSYEGRLASVKSIDSGIKLWILEDAKNHKWIYKHFPSHPLLYQKWRLKGVTDAGEFIYISKPDYTYRFSSGNRSAPLMSTEKSLYESFSVAYFDPKKNSIREVKFGGIAGEDIRRLDKVGFDLINGLHVIPNHIESLMSSL